MAIGEVAMVGMDLLPAIRVFMPVDTSPIIDWDMLLPIHQAAVQQFRVTVTVGMVM